MLSKDSPTEIAYRALLAEPRGLAAKSVARKALRLRGRIPAPAAELLARQLLRGDSRFVEERPGRWALAEPLFPTPIDSVSFAVVDLETTGGTPAHNRIIEIGAFRVEAGRVTDSFCTLVHPGRMIPLSISYLTGIYDEHVKGAPSFEAVAEQLRNFIGDSVFVGHNAWFDASFVNAELGGAGFAVMDNPVVCTLKLSRRLLRGEPRHNLGAVAEAMGVDLKEERHRAPGDACATAHILIGFLERLDAFGVDTVENLLRFQAVRPGAWPGTELTSL